jgi:hypothetical protein
MIRDAWSRVGVVASVNVPRIASLLPHSAVGRVLVGMWSATSDRDGAHAGSAIALDAASAASLRTSTRVDPPTVATVRSTYSPSTGRGAATV